MTDKARKSAYQTLLRIEQDGAFSNLARTGLHALSPLDASFAEALVLGVLEKRRALDWLIGQYVKRETDPKLLTLLRMGVLQIIWMDRVPDSAACNETVSLAKELFGAKRAGFVNAALRSLCREQESSLAELGRQKAEIRYSVGDGVASLLREQYPNDAERIMESFGKKPPLRLRVNRLKADPQEVAERFGAERDGDMLTVTERKAEVIRNADSGEYFIQGYGSQQTVRLLGAQAGETVLDVCACPGGKSFGAALDMENRGRVVSRDLHENKLSLIQKGAKRLGITIIDASVYDARQVDPQWVGKADRVLCDVPCSGLGVLSAKPEIRYKDPASFAPLYQTQRQILASSASYVKNGGVLVYATCTLNQEENGRAVRAFLQNDSGFTLEEEHTWFPYEQAGEGFYAAKLVRKGRG